MSGDRLSGRTVVVTGGNGGIGLGIAQAAAAAGASVMIWARNAEKSERAVAALRGDGASATWATCDVVDRRSVEAAMDATLREFGQVDALVANAAMPGTPSTVLDMEPDDWRAVLDTNLTGVMLSFQVAAGQLVSQGTPGALVAVSSIITRFGAAGRSHYAAAKAGVDSLVASLAVELARHRIRCNALAPGWTRTDLLEDGFGLNEADRFERAILSRTPARRWGEVADYADAAVMLLDPNLGFHTGDTLTIDGGYSVF